MEINQTGLYLIKKWEGFSSSPYLCPAGVWTIGHGHTKGVNEYTQEITEEEAEEMLREDVREAEKAVQQMIDVPLNENQFSALVSLVFNIGAAKFAGSTLRRKLNQGDYAGAALEFDRWVYAAGKRLEGLKRRRASERELFEDEV